MLDAVSIHVFDKHRPSFVDADKLALIDICEDAMYRN
jgi:hypothetical protein